MSQEKRRIYLIKKLLQENSQYQDIEIPQNAEAQKLLLRALFNVRQPQPISPQFKLIEDIYLREENAQKGIMDSKSLSGKIAVWQGDITRLKVDAIVNAANSGLTGCYIPNHNCIDNTIHTYAGIELRNACAKIMEKQGYLEPTGQAKITSAFNLPSKYVIHTVGPIIENEKPTEEQQQLLSSSYLNSLKVAANQNLKTVAFPCISTGIFHFPNYLAAQIAVKTVKDFLNENTTIEKVIFDVYEEKDKIIYEKLL